MPTKLRKQQRVLSPGAVEGSAPSPRGRRGEAVSFGVVAAWLVTAPAGHSSSDCRKRP